VSDEKKRCTVYGVFTAAVLVLFPVYALAITAFAAKPVASLRLVSPGAVTDDVTIFYLNK